MTKTGTIYGINGPIVYVKGDAGFEMHEMVTVGKDSLVGSGSLALSAAPRCWTMLLEIAEMSAPLSMGVIPTETMVLGMLVILESQPISTFCG